MDYCHHHHHWKYLFPDRTHPTTPPYETGTKIECHRNGIINPQAGRQGISTCCSDAELQTDFLSQQEKWPGVVIVVLFTSDGSNRWSNACEECSFIGGLMMGFSIHSAN
jgi:hypothetical protein